MLIAGLAFIFITKVDDGTGISLQHKIMLMKEMVFIVITNVDDSTEIFLI